MNELSEDNYVRVEGALPQYSTYTQAILLDGVDRCVQVYFILGKYELGDHILRNSGNGFFKEVHGDLSLNGLKKQYIDNHSC